MPKKKPGAAARTAVVATTCAAAAMLALVPVTAAIPAPAATPPAPTAVTAVTAGVRTVVLSAPATASRASALTHALAKLGAPYRWGASGPSAFDCSGLVRWAFQRAGVPLPRTSRAMSRVGTPVARSDLRPGDLVFFYRPVRHVAIYVGDGMVVHASTSGQPVKISSLSAMPFSGARRV